MDYNPRTGNTPTGAIEPTGFFTGVRIWPIIFGVVVDFIASEIGRYAYFFVYLPKELAKKGAVTPELISEYMLSSEGLVTSLVIGALGTAVGGFAAARKARKLEVKHGAFVGLGSLIVSALLQAIHEEPVTLPQWFVFVSVLSIIPAGALGGYVAEIFKGGGRSTQGGGQLRGK